MRLFPAHSFGVVEADMHANLLKISENGLSLSQEVISRHAIRCRFKDSLLIL